MTYEYSTKDPRLDKKIYTFSQFEGKDFFLNWRKSRLSFFSKLSETNFKIKNNYSYKKEKNVIHTKDFLKFTAFRCIQKLSICDEKTKMIERKIDITHNLKKKYLLDGTILDKSDAGYDSYSLAAYIFAYKLDSSMGNNLKLLNVLSKSLDIVIFQRSNNLTPLINYCLRFALLTESREINKHLVVNKISI